MRRTGLLALFMVGACSGGDDDGVSLPCEQRAKDFSACGGDVVGSWTLDDFCSDQVLTGGDLFPTVEPCADVPVRTSTRSATGSITFTSGGSYDVSFRAVLGVTIDLSGSCLEALAGASVDPAEICAGVDADSEELACTFAAGVCSCSASQELAVDESGSYSARDGVLSLGDGKPADYCVKSDRAVVRVELDKEGPPYGFFVFERG